jgi:phage terminase Nu1 subunit (DNA packaging protein)
MRKNKQRKIFVNQSELADLEDLSARHIRTLEKEGIFKKEREGYELFLNNPLYIRHVRKQNQGNERMAEKLRYERARASREEMKEAKERGELIGKDV